MTAKTYRSKNNGGNKSNSNDNGVVAGLTVFIPPIAKCAMDGHPGHLWRGLAEDG